MGLSSRKIVFEVDNQQLEQKFEEETPQDVFLDLLFDAQSGGDKLQKLVSSKQLKAKASDELLPDSFESYSLKYVEEVIDVFLNLKDESLVRGVGFDDEEEYSERMAEIKKTGLDKVKGLMSQQEIRNLKGQGVNPENAIWAAKNYKKAWNYTQGSSIPRRILLFYDKGQLAQPDSVTKPYLYVSSDPMEALKAVVVFKYS
jgi:hypothetical protein